MITRKGGKTSVIWGYFLSCQDFHAGGYFVIFSCRFRVCECQVSVAGLVFAFSIHKGTLGRCPSTVRPVFPMLVFQLSEQQNRTRTTSSTVLGTPPNCTRTKRIPLENRATLKGTNANLRSSAGSCGFSAVSCKRKSAVS